ncbi:MerR family transcriptional regulator, partial [Burkholderia pseudomallei]
MNFTVGELAKLNGMNKQTLIYYDNIDLFKPKVVDESNGYRYYTSDQLEVLDSILVLRELGIPIKEIKDFLIKRDDNKALILLKEQKIKLQSQLKNLKKSIARLENK